MQHAQLTTEGYKFEMEERECLNKVCNKSFRVLVTSPQKTCSSSCDEEITTDPKKRAAKVKKRSWVGPRVAPGFNSKDTPLPSFEEAKASPVPQMKKDARSGARKTIAPHAITPDREHIPRVSKADEERAKCEESWKKYVDSARVIVKRMNKDRMEVASLCIEACDIIQGGGAHWSQFRDQYTIKRFAEEIGVTYKTLHGWVRIKRNVIDKLPEGYYDDLKDYHAATSASNHVDASADPDEVKREFDKWKERGTDHHYLLQLHRRVRSGAYFITKRADLAELDETKLRELRDNAQAIVSEINKYFKGH